MRCLRLIGYYLGIWFGVILYCEFIHDYTKMLQCAWPQIKTTNTMEIRTQQPPLQALILADTHLLGPWRGHWLDKLYREWHMHRAFQSALHVLRPELIFVLGDLFDEGDMVNDADFSAYVLRFRRLFRTPPSTVIISAVGNHDVGFHYKMHPYFTERFERSFNNTGVQLYTFRGVQFVFVNSMAMQNDGCDFCAAAQQELQNIAAKLDCLKSETCEDARLRAQHQRYSQPVLMQHFPTYRKSDKICLENDAPQLEQYRENWEVLSKASTDELGRLLQPRLAFAGHSHHYCALTNRLGIDEYTVASFSWRNKINPSFLLATLTPQEHAVYKCDMSAQSTVYNIYLLALCVTSAMLLLQLYKYCAHSIKYSKLTKCI